MTRRDHPAENHVYNGIMFGTRSGNDQHNGRATEVLCRLEQEYGRPDWHVSRPPLDELVITILSQHTSDANCERAFASLRAEFPTWEDVAEADESDIANAIRSGGLADVKAPRIKSVIKDVLAGNLLDDLTVLPLDEAKRQLQALPGVGPKTAACVLLFACQRPALPVDTHVFRVSRRVGLIDDKIDANRAHEQLESMLAPEDIYSFHLNVIKHGRRVCRARIPRCDICALADLCDYAARSEGTNDEMVRTNGND